MRPRHRLLFDLVLAMHAADDLGLPVCGLHLSTAIDQLVMTLPAAQLGWLDEARNGLRSPLTIDLAHLRQHLVFCRECCDDLGLMLVGAYVVMAAEDLP